MLRNQGNTVNGGVMTTPLSSRTIYSSYPDRLHISFIIEMYEIGHCPPHETAMCFLDPETLSRIERGHSQDLFKWQARIAGGKLDRRIHVEISAGKSAIFKRELAVLADHPPAI